MRAPGEPRYDYHRRHSGCGPVIGALCFGTVFWIGVIQLVRWLW